MASLLDKFKGDSPDGQLSVEFSNEFPDEIQQDPAPSKPAKTPRSSASSTTPAKPAKGTRKPATAAVRKQVADELHTYLEMAAMTWGLRDEYCAGVLSDTSQDIADRLADLIAPNPKLVEWLHTSGLVGDWLKLLMAVKPVVSAIKDHHITKTVGGEDDESLDPQRFPAYRPT